MINSMWPSDPIWRHRSGSTLAQVIACCLTPLSNYGITWTNHFKRPCDIHLRAISPELTKPSINEISLKITCLRLQSKLTWATELNLHLIDSFCNLQHVIHTVKCYQATRCYYSSMPLVTLVTGLLQDMPLLLSLQKNVDITNGSED